MLESIVTDPEGNEFIVTHPDDASQKDIIDFFVQSRSPQSLAPEVMDAPDSFGVDVLKQLFTGGSQAAVSSAAGLTQWAGQTFGNDSLLTAAEDMRDFGMGIGQNIGLDQDFQQSLLGNIVAGLGQVPVTIGAGLAGFAVGGPPGALGAAALTTGGQMTSEFLTDMEQSVGKKYTDFDEAEKDAALKGMLAQTALGTTLELAALGKAARPLIRRLKTGKGVDPKKLKEAVEKDKSALREIAESGGLEGFTEAAQGQSLDTLAYLLYDEDRDLMTMDTLKRRSLEFTVGAVVGSTVSGGSQIIGSAGKDGTTRSDLGKPVAGRSEVTVPKEILVTYQPIDGQPVTVKLAIDPDQDALTAAQEILAGRRLPDGDITVTEISQPTPIDVQLGQPDQEVIQEEVPLDPEPGPAPVPVPVPEEGTAMPAERDYSNVKVGDTIEVVGVNGKTKQVKVIGVSEAGSIRFDRGDGSDPGVIGLATDAVLYDINSPEYSLQAAGYGTRGKLIKNLFNDELDALERDINRSFEKNPSLKQGKEAAGRDHISDLNAIKLERRRRAAATEGPTPVQPTPAPEPTPEPTPSPDPFLKSVAEYAQELGITEQEFRQTYPDISRIADERSDPFTDPEPEVGPGTGLPSFTLPQNLREGKPGYRKTQNITFASDLERAVYSATTSTTSEPGKRKRAQYRKLLEDAGYNSTEINRMGREVRAQMRNQYTGPGSPLIAILPKDIIADAFATYIPKRFVGEQADQAPPFFQRFSPEQYDNGRFVNLETKQDLSDQTFEGGSIRIEGGRPTLETSDNSSQTILNSKASEEGPLVRTNLFKQKAGWKWTQAPEGAPSTIVSVEQGSKHYYTLDFSSSKPLTLKTYPEKKSEPRGRPTTRGKVKLGNPVGEISIRGKKHTVYDKVTVGEDIVAQASPAGPVSTEAAVEKIELEQLAPQANEDFFQFWARVLDSTGTRFKPSSRNYGVVAKKAVADTLQFFKDNPKFATYYETDTKLTRQYVEEVVGPISDSEFNLYRILVGLTSPSTKLEDNVVDGLRVFKLFKDNGDFNFIVPAITKEGFRSYDPEKTGFRFSSTTGSTKSTSILALQKKIDQLGLDGAIRYFLEPVTMKELVASKRSLGYKDVNGKTQIKEVVKQATGQDKLIPRMFMFGQKVGSYTMNTLGNVEYTTTDIWESRFIRSYFRGMLESGTGLPSGVDEQKIFQDFSTAFNKEFEKQTGQKIEPASLQAVRWFYILNAFQKTGYQYAKTNDTISGYTAKAAQKLYGIDPASGGQSTSADASQIPAGNRIFNQPIEDATSISERYTRAKGLPVQEPRRIVQLDEGRAEAIGKAYDEMKHDPKNPEVVRAYKALVEETLAQYDAILEGGYTMELSNVEYDNSQAMIDDVRNRKVMRVFSTEDGFGTEGITAKERRENPMLAETGRTDRNGKPLLVNDIFRFVHDFFGHGTLGNGFGPLGEENAWNVHSLMFSPLAQRALTTETRGQNSWVNFSGVNEKAFEIRNQARQARAEGDLEKAKRLSQKAYSTMQFAEQKIGLLPEEFSRSNYQEDVTAQAAETAAEDRGPQETFDTINQLEDFISKSFSSIADKMGINIYPNMAGQFVAQYNVTQKIIEYNPRALLNRSKSGVQAAMREELIHAAMHNVLIQKAKKAKDKRSEDALWVDFFTALGNNLTPQERADIKAVYQSLQEGNAVAFGSEYSRAVVQRFRYGDFTEQYITPEKGGPAFQAIVDLLRSVQAYMAKVLGPMAKTDPEAAQVIVDTVELLNAIDPSIRPKNQQVVANAYDAVDKNAAEENAQPGETADAQASERIREERKWFADTFLGPARSTASKYLTPIITRLNRINPMFGRLLQNLDSRIRERTFRDRTQTEEFFNRLNAVKGDDFLELKQLLFFSPTPQQATLPKNKAIMQRRDALLHKYGLLNMYRLDVQPILDAIYEEYTKLGMPAIGFLEEYFPRTIKDLEGLIKSYGQKTKRTFEMLVRQENDRRKEEGESEMKPEERARFFQDFLQNKFRVDVNGVALPGNLKERNIELIPPDKLKYYDNPGIAFGKYTANMNRAIESFKVVGDTRKGRLQGTLGKLTEDLFNAGQIDLADADELKTLTELITAQFQQENVILNRLGTLTYIFTLVNPGPVLVQIMDLYKVQLNRGVGGVMTGVYRTVTGNRRFDLEKDFSIAKTTLDAEFQDPNVLQKVLDFGLSRLVPFRQMDVAMKHASIEAAFSDFVKKAKAPVGSKKYEQLLNELTITMGRQDALKTIEDLRLDNAKDSVLVKEALLAELLQRQPLTYLQIPEGYQNNPKSRIFYKLGTFMLLDLNYNRQQFLNDLAGPGKTVEQRTVALRRLVYMTMLLTLFGLPSDMLDDFIAGKDTYIPEHVMNNILGMYGFSRYTTTRALEKGFVESALQRFTPPIVNITLDAEQSFRSWIKGDKELFELKSWRNSPLSDVWYNRVGGGKTSQEELRNKRAKEFQYPQIYRSL